MRASARVQRRFHAIAAAQEVRELVARAGADAEPREAVAVVAAVEREELAAAGVQHRGLQREIDGLGAAGGTEALGQATRRDRDQELGKLAPRRIRKARIDIVGTREGLRGLLHHRVAPAEVADAPAHEEIDIAPVAAVEEIAVLASGELELGEGLVGEIAHLASSALHFGSTPAGARRSSAAGGELVRSRRDPRRGRLARQH